jgi:hypothetical protein
MHLNRNCSETFTVDNLGTALVVFLLGDPHSLESRQGGEDRSTKPYGVHALCGCENLGFVVSGGELMHFLPHSFGHSFEKSGTTSKDNVSEHVTTDFNIAFHYGVVTVFWYTF